MIGIFFVSYKRVNDILEIATKLSKINVTTTLVKILNKKSVQKFITNLNTQVQLFNQGENSEGIQLTSIGGAYSPVTIAIKARKGQPSNHVTLKDTGDFYKTFSVTVHQNANFTITANTIKGGIPLTDRWGDDIIGLQKDNVKLVMDLLRNEFYAKVYK